jgi:hypothetical protein
MNTTITIIIIIITTTITTTTIIIIIIITTTTSTITTTTIIIIITTTITTANIIITIINYDNNNNNNKNNNIFFCFLTNLYLCIVTYVNMILSMHLISSLIILLSLYYIRLQRDSDGNKNTRKTWFISKNAIITSSQKYYRV